ncbi:MAG: regulatory protein RecX [Lentisphaeria bacterium]
MTPPEACREAALRLLERKPHSAYDLRRKLFKRDFSKSVIEPVLEDFIRVGLLDDLSLARSYCESRLSASPPVGRRRVQQELRKHGIPANLAKQALEEIWDIREREEILERAEEAARRKLRLIRRDEDPRRKRDKIFRYLAGRGFSTEIIKDAVRNVLDTD